MSPVRTHRVVALMLLSCVIVPATSQVVQERKLSQQQQRIARDFEERVKEYVKLRERLEEQMPKLSKEAKPVEIDKHKKEFQEKVRLARKNSKQGEMFTPETADLIRAIIKDEFKGKERVELRKTVLLDAETKAVPIRVNYPYPDTQEQIETPATLLLQLPQLPKQMRYRFVRRNLLLVDRENGLIIDYVNDAIP